MASPMIEKYDETKKLYPDTILMYQVGDFFEMFREDAIIASKVLDLTLTSKTGGEDDKIPMCGIPIFAVDNYIPKLVQAGYKAAICEQLSAPVKGQLVDRKVVKVVTAGTQTDALDEKRNNYIACIAKKADDFGIVYSDITTGELNMITAGSTKSLEDFLTRIKPSEIIVNSEAKLIERELSVTKLGILPRFNEYSGIAFQFARAERIAKKQFGVNSLSVFDITDKHKLGVSALGALLEYLEETQKRNLVNLNKIEVEKPTEYMYLDSSSRRNLELTENNSTKSKKGSILGLFDHTKTNMGARLLRKYINEPSTNEKIINIRLDAVEELVNNPMLSSDLKEALASVYDIERTSGKIAYGNVTPKDCLNLANSLKSALVVKKILQNSASALLVSAEKNIYDSSEIISLLERAIDPEVSNNTKDGGFIKQGFDSDLDAYRLAGSMGKQWLLELETRLKDETGIKNLKVSYNRVFGYYIEVSKSQVSMVPENWARRQTTTNGERYISEELKKIEEKILGSEEESLKIETKIFNDIKEYLKKYILAFQKTSKAIAEVDVMLAFSETAVNQSYVRPEIDSSIDEIEIIDGRHPVVESLQSSTSAFVPNDTLLDTDENRTMVITGPNMAGKSTYMRQVAIITILAHIGSFVPARKARISITDRIFTRIGASDDLAFGQSTFMVEMTEVATILNNATNKSLLILDEIGRGTSTYDGLSIAWAVLEHLSQTLNTKTLFATHYHELTDLEGKISGIKNYRVLVKELTDSIVFLHKIARGGANKSFGIEVAELAGLPKSVIARAKDLLKYQESANTRATKESFGDEVVSNSNAKDNINIAEIIGVLSDIDMNTVSPLVAFSTLQNLVDKVKK